jgi:KipI family sensor histidine kinase inhibitor
VRLLPVGEDALLAEVPDAAAATAMYVEARRRRLPAAEMVPAARTVLFDGVPDLPALRAALDELGTPDRPQAGQRTVEVPTVYDGQDLDDVARLWDMTRAEVVATHTGTEFTVAFCGFSPGFAYCTGLPQRLSVPRLDHPRTKVPTGSVGLAGAFTGVYPTASPGGWRLVGRTELTLWDVDRERPATLTPGTRVRFAEATP